MIGTQPYIPVQNSILETFVRRRGLSQEDLKMLISPQKSHQHDPFLLKGVGQWIDLLHSIRGLPVAIIPDYDADGVLSGTLARVGLSLFGFGDAYLYPPKTGDGYGMSKTSVDNVLQVKPETRVIITTDNGSNAHEGIDYAKSRGLIVLVTDHHIADKQPSADAVVNPNGHGDNTYPFTQISGTTVIYKVLEAYARKYRINNHTLTHFHSLILLVGISTISDVMPLVNENRFFVVEGIKMLNHFVCGHSTERVLGYSDQPIHQYYRGVDLLVMTLKQRGKLKAEVNADTFGFMIGPILNSPRRMLGDSDLAFQLFQTNHNQLMDVNSLIPSDVLFEINEQRKSYVQHLTTALFTHMNEKCESAIDTMVFNARMYKGVAGLLSGNFTKKFGLPSIAFAAVEGVSNENNSAIIDVPVSGDHMLVGSARSPETFNLHAFLTLLDVEHPKLIEKWGGHPQAAGISIKAKNYELFRHLFISRYKELLVQQEHHEFVEEPPLLTSEYVLTTDAYERLCKNGMSHSCDVIPLHGGTTVFSNHTLWEALTFFEQMEPFGHGLPRPTFNVVVAMEEVDRVFRMGTDKQHVKLMLCNGLSIIHWNGASEFQWDDNHQPDNRIFIISGSLGINRFNGNESVQLIASDVIEYKESHLKKVESTA